MTNVPLRPSFDAEQPRDLRTPRVRATEWAAYHDEIEKRLANHTDADRRATGGDEGR